jgi:Reverse transcriptase (RNA-dependent DNA polymerase)
MPGKKQKKFHSLKDSVFYKLSTRTKLAEYLYCSSERFRGLTTCDDLYQSWQTPKKNGGFRLIEAPRDDLKRIQKRIADLLQRIEPPPFLFSPVAGRSYVDNAAHHLSARAFRLIDLEDFFPSCTANRVHWFFKTKMECSSDVTAILRTLTTKQGRLPQGSPCSPILAYYSYMDMWDEINEIAKSFGYKISIYADDVTISDEKILERAVWDIKKTLRRFGHSYKVDKDRRVIDSPADITGVIINNGKLLLPNRQHLKIHNLKKALSKSLPNEEKTTLLAKLHGSEAQARQVLQHKK